MSEKCEYGHRWVDESNACVIGWCSKPMRREIDRNLPTPEGRDFFGNGSLQITWNASAYESVQRTFDLCAGSDCFCQRN